MLNLVKIFALSFVILLGGAVQTAAVEDLGQPGLLVEYTEDNPRYVYCVTQTINTSQTFTKVEACDLATEFVLQSCVPLPQDTTWGPWLEEQGFKPPFHATGLDHPDLGLTYLYLVQSFDERYGRGYSIATINEKPVICVTVEALYYNDLVS